ncbi:hypothetical protein [Parapedobacter sp. 10938]|uniref:hypothetical protein n=1 Tax=Parapedobacter flavus TaxID=3110225 RepID=UPI002DB57F2B|nr:hypothetical protein [Parapedobacter sp. 10938]MEC3881985.1 hypothetical protein [Parapedobacter sp. 10938]
METDYNGKISSIMSCGVLPPTLPVAIAPGIKVVRKNYGYPFPMISDPPEFTRLHLDTLEPIMPV